MSNKTPTASAATNAAPEANKKDAAAPDGTPIAKKSKAANTAAKAAPASKAAVAVRHANATKLANKLERSFSDPVGDDADDDMIPPLDIHEEAEAFDRAGSSF